MRRATVEHGLKRDVRHRAHQLGERGADRAQGRDRLCALGQVTGPDEHQSHHRLAVLFRRQERHRRGEHHRQGDPKLVGRLGRVIAEDPQHFHRITERPEDRPAEHDRPHWMELVLEGGSDPEVASPAAQPPEELRFGLGVDVQPLAVGVHEVD